MQNRQPAVGRILCIHGSNHDNVTVRCQYGFSGADGAAIRTVYGTLSFEGAANFSRNEVVGELSHYAGIYYEGGEAGALYASCGYNSDEHLSFKGEVTFEGNKGQVSSNLAHEKVPNDKYSP